MVLLKKRAHLVFKAPPPMVRLLLLDIPNQGPGVRRTYRKRPIPTLPRKLLYTLHLKPSRRRGLHLSCELRQALCRVQTHRKMHMVRNATRPVTLASRITRHGSQIRMQPRPHSLIENRPAIFRTEDHMNQDKRERLRHRSHYGSGLQPFAITQIMYLGRCPRLV